jgi:hypothetical protein
VGAHTDEQKGRAIRFLMKIMIPVNTGNEGIKNQTLFPGMQKTFDMLKPEAVYFGVMYGQRNVFIIVDVPSADKIPFTVEPFWLDLNADITIIPVLNRADMEKAGKDFEKLSKERQ